MFCFDSLLCIIWLFFTVVWVGLFVWVFAFGLVFVVFCYCCLLGLDLDLVVGGFWVWLILVGLFVLFGSVVMIFSDLCWVITLVMLGGLLVGCFLFVSFWVMVNS